MSRFVRLCYPMALAVLAAGCYIPQRGGSVMQRVVDARELYCEADFGMDSLRRAGVSPLAARLSFGNETFAYPLRQGLVEVLEKHIGEAAVHPNTAVNRINQAGLTEGYAAMLEAYDHTHVLDQASLQRLAEAVRVRYFAVPILISFGESVDTRFSVFGVRLGKTASANARLQLQIWDGQHGRVVWEGRSDLTLGQETLREERIRFEDTVQATWDSLIEQMPP